MPMKIAVKFDIPLVFWGEHGWTDMGGMHSMHDLVEYTARYRKDQCLRGYDWYDMLGDLEDPVAESELEWSKYPSDEEIFKLGLTWVDKPWFTSDLHDTRLGAVLAATQSILN